MTAENVYAARHAEVVGAAPRIEPIAEDDVDPATLDLMLRVRAGAGAGAMVQIPEYFRTLVKHPELFATQLEMGTVFFNGRLPKRERELAILRVGWLCRAPYEWGQHVKIAKRVGVTDAEVVQVIVGPDAPEWCVLDRAVLSAVDQLFTQQAIDDATWAVLAAQWDEAQMIEFPLMVGQYVALAYAQNALRVRLEGDNTGLDYR